MEQFALYLFRSSIWLTAFAFVYLLFLRNERFFLVNRIYLIAGILSALIFPLISIRYTVYLPAITTNNISGNITSFNSSNKESLVSSLSAGMILLYISGALFVAFLIIKQSRSVLKSVRKADVLPGHSVNLIRSDEYDSSFSFFSYVFVNPSVTDVEAKEILNHEMVHISQKHWFDLMLAELLCIIQWFNPMIWIYIRLIRQNHEYLADEGALQRTSDPVVYRATLLNQIVGSSVYLANSFSYSLNKKRFDMMKNIIKSPYRKLKILLILPVIALVLYSFAKPEYRYITTNGNRAIINTESRIFINEIKGKVLQEDGKPLAGASVIISGTTTGTITDLKGYFAISNVPEEGSLVVTCAGFKSKVIKADFNKEMIIKMTKQAGYKEEVKEWPNNAAPPPPPPPPPPPAPPTPPAPASLTGNLPTAPEQSTPVLTSSSASSTTPPGVAFRSPDGKKPIFVVDSKISDNISSIDPNSIESISVLKSSEAIEKYGEKAKDGLIEITLKKELTGITSGSNSEVIVIGYRDQKSDSSSHSEVKVIGYGNPKSAPSQLLIRSHNFGLNNPGNPASLIIIDGVEMGPNFISVAPDDIQSMTVLKSESATKLYGEKGKTGVILITTKKKLY
jgi:TonB-dependent SusC/RagA subfamily outer membrane receptor